MNARASCVWLSVLTLASGAAGDDKAVPKPPEVEFVLPVAREVSDHEDFAGRIEPSTSVRLRARVTGYVERVRFADGDRVKKGDLLFEIDPRPYKAELDKADAGVTLATARLKRAEIRYKQEAALSDSKTISRGELDKLTAGREEAQARLAVAKAVRELAALNFAFTRVTAPIDGRIGRRLLDVGNLVKADETTLATLTGEGPMYVYFDIDERTLLALRRAAGKEAGKALQVAVGLADEADFPRRAEVNYLDNIVDSEKGTIRLRATLPNADGMLLPGLSVRVRLTTSKPYNAQMVPVRAMQAGRGSAGGRGSGTGRASGPRKAILLVVNGKDEVEEREVVLGSRHGDLVAVREGLNPTDRVVLAGRSRPKAGAKVEPKKAETSSGKE